MHKRVPTQLLYNKFNLEVCFQIKFHQMHNMYHADPKYFQL